MATKKVGAYVKEARAGAKLTQEKLGQATGIPAGDIGKCERGEIDLTAAQLKKIAVACGVTQSSLVNAPKNLSASAAKKAAAEKKAETAKKTAAAKTSTAKKTTTAKKTEAKKNTVPAGANVSMKVTASEKKLVEAYRSASSDLKKISLKVLKGEYGDTVTSILNVVSGNPTANVGDQIGETLGNLLGGLIGKK